MRVGLIGYGYWGPNLARALTRRRNVNLPPAAMRTQEALARPYAPILR